MKNSNPEQRRNLENHKLQIQKQINNNNNKKTLYIYIHIRRLYISPNYTMKKGCGCSSQSQLLDTN